MDLTSLKRAPVAAPLVFLSALGLLGCQTLIDLGEEPELIEDEETDPEPSATDEGICSPRTPPQRAFLDDTTVHTSGKCTECLNAQCCDVLLECADDMGCTDTVTQFRYCYEGGCVLQLLSEVENELTLRTANCFVGRCGSTCAPGPKCQKLGTECCDALTGPVRNTCSLAAHTGDEDHCEDLRLGSLAALCPPPTE